MNRNDFLISELWRRMNNIVRPGRIHSVDTTKARARVEVGAIITDWLPWATTRAGNDRTWWAPTVGEQVVILAPSGELNAAFIVASFFTSAFPAPANVDTVERVIYRDGTIVEYDTSAHKLAATVKGDAEITTTGSIAACAESSISVKAGSDVSIEAEGDVSIKGANISLTGPVKASSSVSAKGVISSDDDVKGASISLVAHKHSGVMSGGSMTSTPI